MYKSVLIHVLKNGSFAIQFRVGFIRGGNEKSNVLKHCFWNCLWKFSKDAVFHRTYPLLYHKFWIMVNFSVRTLIRTL